jgi:predicted aspartyl protease
MIQWLIEHGKKVEDWAAPKRSEFYLKGGCAKLEGKGRASIAVKPNAPTIPVKATVNGKKGSFLLAERSAFVTLSQKFAQRAGLEGGADVDPVLVFGELLAAKVTTAKNVAVGKAKAPDVRVAIVEELPGDVDGVIGLSYLWRFSVEKKPKAVVLKAR